jgi:hypothetical protein
MRYMLFTVLTACAVSLFYFAPIWRNPNAFLFTASGDGLQGYYQSLWHTQLDAQDWQQSSMNYPYGESIFFTGGQPVLTNAIRWLKPVIDLSAHAVSATNLFILCSGIWASLFLFLIFKRLQVSNVYAWLFAVAILLPAQQWDRTGGHFALAVMFAIPLLVWLQLGFFQAAVNGQNQIRLWTAGMVVSLFVLGLIQFYYVFFAAAIAGGMTIIYLLRSLKISKWELLLHVALQFILPFAALQGLLHWSTAVSDRTAIPWGFMVFRSNWLSYLFPYGMPYERWFEAFKPEHGLEWEGLAYIGLAGVTLVIFAILAMFIKRFRSKLSTEVYALAVVSVVCIAASMAFPFNWGFERLLYRLGAIQQFRGIGRFAFVAYYPILILLVTLLHRSLQGKRILPVLSGIILLMMTIDGHARLSQVAQRISNDRGELLTKVQTGIDGVQTERYQAIHPLPYVHVGSENIGATGSDEAMRELYQASLQTGLPTTATVMSRTSLSQSFRSCAMAWELMEVPAILQEFPDKRPLLVIADRAHVRPVDEQLLQFAQPVLSHGEMDYFELPLAAFDSVLAANANRAEHFAEACTVAVNPQLMVDTLAEACLFLDSTLSVIFTHGWRPLAEFKMNEAWKGQEMAVSFWVEDFSRDLIPRSILEVIQFSGERSVDYQTEFLGKRIIGMRQGRALVEYRLLVHPEADRLTLAIENKLIQGSTLEINSLLIRPIASNCRILRHGKESLNNRIYSR